LQGSGGTFKVEDLTNDPTGVLAGKATAYVVKTYDVNHVLLNTTNPSSTEPTITFGTYAGGAIFIDVFVTYNEGVAYNLLVKPSTVSTSCTDQVSFSGAAPDCCVPYIVNAGDPTKNSMCRQCIRKFNW
jgi:hypothetical protein